MSNLTIRIEKKLKKEAIKQAEKLGISVTFIVTNALKKFVKNPVVIIGEPEDVAVTPGIQKQINKIADIVV